MNRYQEINEEYSRTQALILELDMEYQNKIKGEVYNKRKLQLINKLDGLKKKALRIGVEGNICHIQGKRHRPHIKNPKILVTERFNLYFVNITEEEASALVKLHIKNAIQYTIRFIRPGIIINTN